MSVVSIRKYKYAKAATASLLIVFLLAVSPILLIDIKHAEIKPMGTTQLTWQDAMTGCSSLGGQWSLPSIYQLGAIYYRRPDIELTGDTDYWSINSIAGFAFGLNTGRGIASFDRYADTDHYLCVQRSLK